MDEDQQRLMEIFNEARAKASAKERDAYLASACGEDAALRRQVETLLQAHTHLGDFLKPPADDPADDCLNTVIGRYKLLERIGEGGFGAVYMAEQKEPVHRRVALKIIKAGMDTKEVIARFEAERQALALMDHPSIARVLDAGATETGRPYFVMELVKGIPITEYCDQGNLSMPDRLQLFMQVCHAVQHAHQKGIIHRDLKPSNILITMIDGKPVPKIIDFGVAKALGQQLTEKTLFTSFQQIVGTPLYMSPEQAAISGVDVDTRSDIYSLGVLLYELLTGATPFDEETFRKAALDDMRRMIREVDPPKPSTRLQTLGDRLTEVAQHRHAEPSSLTRLVHGDLDWIVMRCLEKERARRYETANALRADIQRHLEHQPVLARRPGAAYKAQKFVRRHVMGVALAASVMVALILGLISSLIGFSEARRERDRAVAAELEQSRLRAVAQRAQMQAEANEKSALEAADRSQRVTQLQSDTLENIASAAVRDRAVILSILNATTNRISEALRYHPEVEAELRTTIGDCYNSLLRSAEAEAMFREAFAIQEQLFGKESVSAATSLVRLADVLSLQGKQKDAEKLLREAIAIDRRLLGDEHRTVANGLGKLAEVLLRQSQTAATPQKQALLTEAEALQIQALTIRRKLFGDEHLDIAQSLDDLTLVFYAQGKTAEAERGEREALAMRRKLLGDEHLLVAMSFLNLAEVLTLEGKYGEAEQLYRDALAMRRKLLGDEHPDVAYALGHLAVLLRKQGKLSEAEAANREAFSINAIELGDEHPNTMVTLVQLANVLSDQGKLAESEALEMSSANDPALYYCALVHLSTGDTNSYRTITTRIAAQLQTNAPNQNTHLVRWACALAPDAVPDFSPVLQATRQALAGETNTVNSYSDQQTLGALLYRTHRYDEAVQALTQTFELAQRLDAKTLQASPAYGAYFLTMAHVRLGHAAEARECFQRASALDPLTAPVETNVPSRISWNRRITLELLRKEAESLLKSDAPDSDTN